MIGNVYAIRLVQAGNDVRLLARGKRLEELKEHGLVIQEEPA